MASTLEKRLDALEQAAKVSAAQNKPTIVFDVEVMRQRLQNILAREGPKLTQAEQIQEFKDGVARMNRNWELRHGSR